jgi:hypothetical protein
MSFMGNATAPTATESIAEAGTEAHVSLQAALTFKLRADARRKDPWDAIYEEINREPGQIT